MSDHGGDLTRTPLAYPGVPVPGPRLVVGDCAHTVRPRPSRSLGSARSDGCARCDLPPGAGPDSLDRLLGRLGATPLAERTPVLAVGSNAVASVVRHKLTRRGIGVVVPLLTGVVRHLAVGHTAYVSRGGYVPAAPVHRSRARTPVVLQLLDDHQLAAIDATEPHYDRVELTGTRYPLVLAGGLRPARYHVYEASGGVLSLPVHGRRLLPQPEVLGALRDEGLPHTDHEDPSAIAERLAGSAAHRDDVREGLAARGLTRGSGLTSTPAGRLRWPETVRAVRAPRRQQRRQRR
ncbi:hypothetical protein [uncultured Phycicoccus sp.]|uniref:hypothetical protein n=1 Tax=uncultured Phycicoccus sp. TaxID=661422 RepID=UPI00260D5680|nr:hypothetical protein [uncultured Phycicoccus sp.]